MSELDEANNIPAKCLPSRPCHRWRTCARCARRRQANVANAVDQLGRLSGTLSWHILYPNDPGPDALRASRSSWLRAARPSGAIWTVEQSRKTGALHCNIITPAGSLHEPVNAHHWQQIITGNPRHVGAYIAKPGQIPKQADYSGRLYGTAGQIWHLLAEQTTHPAVAAAAAQYAIDSMAMRDRAVQCLVRTKLRSIDEHNAFFDGQRNQPPQTKEDYRAIAARWLPDLLEWKEQNRPKNSLDLAREFMQREGD